MTSLGATHLLLILLVCVMGCNSSEKLPSLMDLSQVLGELPSDVELVSSGTGQSAGKAATLKSGSLHAATSRYWITLSSTPLPCPLTRTALGAVVAPEATSSVVVSTISTDAIKNFVVANYSQVEELPQVTATQATSIEWQKNTMDVRLRECQADVRWLSIIEVIGVSN